MQQIGSGNYFIGAIVDGIGLTIMLGIIVKVLQGG
jgi:hypothetical protein